MNTSRRVLAKLHSYEGSVSIMTPFFIVLYSIYFTSLTTDGEKEVIHQCNGFQANYNISEILGTWYVVAIVPDTGFPRLDTVACYKMDVSETDEASLRWLVSKKIDSPSQDFLDRIKGTIIRQRYHSEKPFDIWSKAVRGVNGCFKQLLTLETKNHEIADAQALSSGMQLHLMGRNEDSGPYLVQILWGRLIAAVIYRRAEGVSLERLEPIHDFLTKLRGYQKPLRICDTPTREIVRPPNERP